MQLDPEHTERTPLYPGDIVAAACSEERWYPVMVTGPSEPETAHNVRARAKRMSQSGRVHPGIGIYFCDRLVACGRDEDCRASLDLAMACAAERVASHQVSASQTAKGPQR